MKTIIKLLVVLALALTTFAQHSTASAATVIRSQGSIIYSQLVAYDDCLVIDMSIFAGQSSGPASPGKPDTTQWVSVHMEGEDVCVEEVVLYGDGQAWLSNEDLSVSNTLKSATLHATVPVTDYISGTTFDVSIDLIWTATEPLFRNRSADHIHTPGCTINNQLIEKSRYAEVQGTVTDGTRDYFDNPYGLSWLISETRGEVVIGCD